MVDSCVITRVTGRAPAAGGHVTETLTTVYSGPCRFQQPGGYGRNAIPTPVDPVLMHYRVLQLPVATSSGIEQGDRVTVVACVNDPSLVGAQLVVRDQDDGKSEATVRRLGVDQVTG